MALDLARLEKTLCESMCADVRLHPRSDGRIMVETPFLLGDGDTYAIFLEPLASGGIRITDAGHTLMHLSYSMDVDLLREGTRGLLFEKIINESPVQENDGEIFLDTPIESLGKGLFSFGQALTRVHDLCQVNSPGKNPAPSAACLKLTHYPSQYGGE